MKWQDVKKQPCSIARSLAEVGDRWTLLVLRQAFAGNRRFSDIAAGTGAQRNIVADRLKRLVAADILQRHLYQENPPRHEYRLTEKGHDLYPVLLALVRWGDRWLDEGKGRPLVYVHQACGQPTEAKLVCSYCDEPITSRDIVVRAGPGRPLATASATRSSS